MLKIVGWCCVGLVAVVMSVNATYMLVSPRAWFRLPEWIGARGTMTEAKYGTGFGAVQVRLAGAVLLGVLAWVIFDSLIKRL
jgi:hypothetical protein